MYIYTLFSVPRCICTNYRFHVASVYSFACFEKIGTALCATRSCLLVPLHQHVHYQTKRHGRCSHLSYAILNCFFPSAMLFQHHCSHGISFV